MARSRLAELDAVRGIAAVTVMLGHCAIAFPRIADNTRPEGVTALNVLKYSPVRLIFDGFPAVVVFFVLSGLVLTLQIQRSYGTDGYRSFAIRRICRIWLPYIAAVALAFIVAAPVIGEPNAQFSSWFNDAWQHSLTPGRVATHVTLIGSFDNDQYDPVLWSLVHEMRISLIFPFLVAGVIALGPLRSGVVTLVVAALGYGIGSKIITGTDYFVTLEYLMCFVAGIWLADRRAEITALVARLTRGQLIGLWALAAILLSWKNSIPSGALPHPLGRAVHQDIVDIPVTTAGAVLLIVLAQTPGPKRLLLQRLPQFLGRISYSLYLVHTIVLLAVLHVAHTRSAAAAALPLVIVGSIALAALMHGLVEVPAQKLGRALGRRAVAPVAAEKIPA